MASLPDPSDFAISVAVGYSYVLNSALGSMDRASMRDPVLDRVVAVLLAVLVLMAYLVAVTLAFAVRIAAESYALVVAGAQAAALSPVAMLASFANTVIKLAVAFFIFRGLAVGLFQYLT